MRTAAARGFIFAVAYTFKNKGFEELFFELHL